MSRHTVAALLALALALPAAAPLAAQAEGRGLEPDPKTPNTRAGTRGANFLRWGVGARAQALGGAYTALADDVFALYWNPAGAAGIARLSAAYSRADIFGEAGITHEYVAAALPALGGVVGVSLNAFDSGDIPLTTADYPQGGDPTFGSTFSWTASAIGVHYARFITDRLAVGIAGKAVSEGTSFGQADYVALDAGVRFRTGLFGTTIGASLQNVGSEGAMQGAGIERRIREGERELDALRPVDVRLETRPASLPTAFHFSILTDLVGAADAVLAPSAAHRLAASLDFGDAIDTGLQTGFGVEYAYRDRLFLRGGRRFANEARTDFRDANYGLSLGGGLRLPLGGGRRIGLDYAYVDYGELENVRTLSVAITF